MPRPRPSKSRSAAAAPSPEALEGAVRATVLRVFPGSCQVHFEGGEALARRPPLEPVTVGDQVWLGDPATAPRVLAIQPRRTVLSRPDPHDPGRELLIAANVDVVVVVLAVKNPPFHPRLLDRYLVAAGRGGAEAVVCLNKLDLATADERLALADTLGEYAQAGISVHPCSAETGEGLEAIRERITGRVCVFAGHSGVGKSSLVAALLPESGARVGAVSPAHGKGRHTTTGSELYALADGTRVIDTPGVRSFGLWAVDARALGWYFPDFDAHRGGCRFSDCTHSHEPRCGVREAARAGALSAARYDTYLRILASLG
ncbi:MAG: ribosome small subunit-dependent GTPase A [Deltaproteobacteria bacterium]|nr:ribosome small subunit-dependent GTPase A [Deltaproteobacteria bacterium]